MKGQKKTVRAEYQKKTVRRMMKMLAELHRSLKDDFIDWEYLYNRNNLPEEGSEDWVRYRLSGGANLLRPYVKGFEEELIETLKLKRAA